MENLCKTCAHEACGLTKTPHLYSVGVCKNYKTTEEVQPKDMEKLPKIIAVDFDGTLVSNEYPEIGRPNKNLFSDLIRAKEQGCKIILWTCRNNGYLEKAVRFCNQQGLELDAVNENLPEIKSLFGTDTRKVYADVYIDDKVVAPEEDRSRVFLIVFILLLLILGLFGVIFIFTLFFRG